MVSVDKDTVIFAYLITFSAKDLLIALHLINFAENKKMKTMKTTADKVFQIFKQLNNIPRPSHHEERVADFLCDYARELNLEYERDSHNCVVIRKPATPGHEKAEPIVLLNHMDMVCVSDENTSVDFGCIFDIIFYSNSNAYG